MKKYIDDLLEMRSFLLLWFTQMISGLGSAMTGYAPVIWPYTQEGSALRTALLMVCSYAPYVICGVFAGALSDRWDKKKTMLICDTLAAGCSLAVLVLLKADQLRIGHLYIVNAISGLMNTVQQPASEVATTALLPRKFYQKVGGLWYLSSSLSSILTPIIATAVLGLWEMDAVIAINRLSIPAEIQGRVFAARNSFQFFTIPVGYLLGGFLLDRVFEPVMAAQTTDSILFRCFGAGKGSGATFFFAVLCPLSFFPIKPGKEAASAIRASPSNVWNCHCLFDFLVIDYTPEGGGQRMELNDVYDENRNLTGKVHKRGTPWNPGEYGVVVCVWVYDGQGHLLLTRRARGKSFAGTWENSGGAVKAGETSRQAIARELYEETGIQAQPEEFEFLDTDKDRNMFYDHYCLCRRVPLKSIVLLPGETDNVMWASFSKVDWMIRVGKICKIIGHQFYRQEKALRLRNMPKFRG